MRLGELGGIARFEKNLPLRHLQYFVKRSCLVKKISKQAVFEIFVETYRNRACHFFFPVTTQYHCLNGVIDDFNNGARDSYCSVSCK